MKACDGEISGASTFEKKLAEAQFVHVPLVSMCKLQAPAGQGPCPASRRPPSGHSVRTWCPASDPFWSEAGRQFITLREMLPEIA